MTRRFSRTSRTATSRDTSIGWVSKLSARFPSRRTTPPPMLRGTYRNGIVGGVPPYLDRAAHSATRERLESLELVDGGYAEYLARCDDDSIDGFALSKICEWLDDEQIQNLFAQVVRVARPGARLCFRNFVGHTEIPEAFR